MRRFKAFNRLSIINIIKFITSIIKMSDSSLSSTPNSPLPPSEPSLPTLPPTPFVQPIGLQSFLSQPIRSHKKPSILESTLELFTTSLYSYTLLDTNPPTIQIRCLQPGCLYMPKPQLLSFK
jgi:hypothetical protein